MKAYVEVTGLVFLVITISHALRAFLEEGTARDPWFWVATAMVAAFAVWAIVLRFRKPRANAP